MQRVLGGGGLAQIDEWAYPFAAELAKMAGCSAHGCEGRFLGAGVFSGEV